MSYLFRYAPTFLATVLALLSFLASASGAGYLIQAGPMIGHVSDSTATVWIRLKMDAQIEATASQEDQTIKPSRVEDLGEGFHLIHFTGLQPETATSIALKATRAHDDPETSEVTFKTAPKPGDTGNVRIAFGSCSKLNQYADGPVYEAIAEEKPDFSIFVGDNIYFIVGDGGKRHNATTGPRGDWSFYESMVARHLETRVHPDLQRMFRTVPSYAVWDDHDYCANNEDSTNPLKQEATLAFKRVWANPAYGTRNTAGIFSSFRHGPVEVFLMDDRTHKYSPARHDDVTVETGRIWGDAQLDWLIDGLRKSTAPVKIIANGTQFISLDERGEGHHQEARGEQQRLLQFLADEKIGGIVFLSGDRHHSEAMQLVQPDGTLIVECTSSPLQQGQEVKPFNRPHDNQLWAMYGNSYGLVTIDIPEKGAGTIRFEARTEDNKTASIDNQPRESTWKIADLVY